MQPEDRESWFWKLSEAGDRAPREDSAVADDTLEAYRAGRLPDDEARRVEHLLVTRPANRRRLLELSGLTPAEAPAGVLRRLLSTVLRPAPRPATRRWQWAALAAAAAVTVVFGWAVLRPGLPPAYEVGITALKERRFDDGVLSEEATAYAGTPVTIIATVEGEAVKGVEVALYRDIDGRLSRLVDGIDLIEDRGVVRFEAPASALVGTETVRYEIFVVVAWQGRLPAAIELEPGDDSAALLAGGGRRQVRRLTLRLLAENSAPPSADGDSSSDEEKEHVTDRTGHLRSPLPIHAQRFRRLLG